MRLPLLAEGIWGPKAVLQLDGSTLTYQEHSALSTEATQRRLEQWLLLMSTWAALPEAYR